MVEEQKCRCRGSNSECNFCFGTGIVGSAGPQIEIVAVTPKPAKNNRRPGKLPRPPAVGRGIDLHDAILRHGSIGPGDKSPIRMVRLLDQLRKDGHDDPRVSAISQSVRTKVTAAARLPRVGFAPFVRHFMEACSGNPAKGMQRFTTVNAHLAGQNSPVRFTADEANVLASVFKRSRGSKKSAAADLKGRRILQPLSKKRRARLEREQTAVTPVVGIVGYLVMATGKLDSEGLASLETFLEGRKATNLYVGGPKSLLRQLQDEFPAFDATLVTQAANVQSLRSSANVLVWEADSLSKEPSARRL